MSEQKTKEVISRLLIELTELRDKIRKLDNFLNGGKPKFISNHSWSLLAEQAEAMDKYEYVLLRRYRVMSAEFED